MDFYDQVRTFYEDNRHQLFAYAVSITGERELAEDLVQVAVFALLSRGSMPREPKPYMFRTVRNRAIDEHRRRLARGQDRPRALSTSAPIVDDVDLDRSLGLLSEDERATVILKVWGGLTLREIARVIGCPSNTVGSWYRRALAKLRTDLEEGP